MSGPGRGDDLDAAILESWVRLSARSRPRPVALVRRDPVRPRAVRPSAASLAASLAVVVAVVAIGVLASRPGLQPGGSPTPSGGSPFVAVVPSVMSPDPDSPVPQSPAPSATPAPIHIPGSSVEEGRLVSATDGWALQSGALLATHDGGRSWSPTTLPTRGDRIVGAAFADGLHGWLVSETYPVQGASGNLVVTVHRTDDGGATWQSVVLATISSPGPDAVIGFPTFSVLSADRVFIMLAVADDAARAGQLFASADGGRSWVRRGGVRDVGASSFLDATHGWAIRSDSNTLVRTNNGGRSWVRADLPAIPGVDPSQLYPTIPIAMPDRLLLHLLAARDGDAGVFLVSDDGGDHWSIARGVPAGPGGAVAVLGDGTWIFGSQPIQRSIDHGATWIPVETDLPGGLESIAVVAGTHLSAIVPISPCYEGPGIADCFVPRELWISDDGGNSWRNATP